MYAQHSYTPRQPRTVSFGAAFAINGAIIAGIGLFLAPQFVPKQPVPILKIKDIPIDLVPPPIDPPKPKPEPRASVEPPIVTPIPRVDIDRTTALTTTDKIPDTPPVPDVIEKTGPTTIIGDPPLPPPPLPLIAASLDPRYAAALQPDYPPSELRAQRDGEVRVRVRIGIDGRVKAVEQISATSSAFFEATRRQALGKWRFKPAVRGDVPQESWKVMTLKFRITDL
jgi:periplasmic protein TonB